MANKITQYYKPRDERMPEYFFEHIKLLGLDKYPFGLTEFGVLAFEGVDSNSPIWQKYKLTGGSLNVNGNTDFVWNGFQSGEYTLEDVMQFYRELGISLTAFIDSFSTIFYADQDKKTLNKSLERIKNLDTFGLAKEEMLETIFMAHMNGVEDALIYEYKKSSKNIIVDKFGIETWTEFVEVLKKKNNTDD